VPDELVIILGTEATLLIYVSAMILRSKRIDVLSGRFFERPVTPPAGNRHLLRAIRYCAHDLSRLTRAVPNIVRIHLSDLSRRVAPSGRLRSGIQATMRRSSYLGRSPRSRRIIA